MQPNKIKRRVLASFLCAACFAPSINAKDDLAKPPPPALPLFDGAEGRTHQASKTPLIRPAVPEYRKLYDMVLACWPTDSWFRGELYAEARISNRTRDNSTLAVDQMSGNITQQGDRYVGLVARIPIVSAVELDKERTREFERRGKVAEAVAQLVSTISERELNTHELSLFRALEKRAQERVRVGVAETAEQVRYLEHVALLEMKVETLRAAEIKARLEIVGMCDSRKISLIDDYLNNFKSAR